MDGKREPVKVVGETLEADSFREYLEDVKRYSPHTASAYFTDVCEFYLFLEEREQTFSSAEVKDCKEFIFRLNASRVTHKTIKRKVSALKTFYSYLIETGAIKINPFDLVRTPRADRKLPDFLTPDQMATLFQRNLERDDPLVVRDEAILELMFASGIRAEETIDLTLGTIDLDQRTMKVLGKGKKERLVPFSVTAKKSLERYLNELRPKLVLERSDGSDTDVVFLNSRGEKLTERGLQYILKRIGDQTGFPGLHPHTLRHSYATFLVNRGANLRQIQEFMGHASIGTTAIYSHVSYEELKATYDKAFVDPSSKGGEVG